MTVRGRRLYEAGFTLIELLVTISIVAILLTLAAAALRQFWFVRSLEGGADGIVTQLRNMQQRAVAESNPVVYGAAFVEGTSTWGLIRYLPPVTPGPGTCSVAGTRTLDAGVIFSSVSFTGAPAGLNVSDAEAVCGPLVSGATADDLVFFLARGTARAGSVTLRQPNIDRTKVVSVIGLTSRITKQ